MLGFGGVANVFVFFFKLEISLFCFSIPALLCGHPLRPGLLRKKGRSACRFPCSLLPTFLFTFALGGQRVETARRPADVINLRKVTRGCKASLCYWLEVTCSL